MLIYMISNRGNIVKENVIGVMAFVEQEEDCVISCSKNDMCSFYKVTKKCTYTGVPEKKCPFSRSFPINNQELLGS